MKKPFLILIAAGFLLITFDCWSQKQGRALLDSLIAEVPKAKEDKNKVSLYDKIILEYIEISSYDGLQYEKPATELALKLNWKAGTGGIKNDIGKLYWRKGNFDAALKYHFEALKIFQELDDKSSIGNSFTSIGQDYADSGNYTEALKYFKTAFRS